jgi:hypothetical protein
MCCSFTVGPHLDSKQVHSCQDSSIHLRTRECERQRSDSGGRARAQSTGAVFTRDRRRQRECLPEEWGGVAARRTMRVDDCVFRCVHHVQNEEHHVCSSAARLSAAALDAVSLITITMILCEALSRACNSRHFEL